MPYVKQMLSYELHKMIGDDIDISRSSGRISDNVFVRIKLDKWVLHRWTEVKREVNTDRVIRYINRFRYFLYGCEHRADGPAEIYSQNDLDTSKCYWDAIDIKEGEYRNIWGTNFTDMKRTPEPHVSLCIEETDNATMTLRYDLFWLVDDKRHRADGPAKLRICKQTIGQN